MDFPISILVAEDHPLFRDALVDYLKELSSSCHIDQASNGIDCISHLDQREYDLVLLDINMPEMDGIECMKVISNKWPTQKVAVLTQYDQSGFLSTMMELGAVGYFLKSTSPPILLDSILTLILDNSPKYNKHVSDSLRQIQDILTPRELDIIPLMADDLSTEEIANRLAISENTVSNHRSSILRKLNLKGTTGVMKWALKNGFTNELEF